MTARKKAAAPDEQAPVTVAELLLALASWPQDAEVYMTDPYTAIFARVDGDPEEEHRALWEPMEQTSIAAQRPQHYQRPDIVERVIRRSEPMDDLPRLATVRARAGVRRAGAVMKMIIEGMPRPSAVDAARDGGGYLSVEIDAGGPPVFTEHRVQVVGHDPCGWQHPTWPDEAEGRMWAHRMTREMRAPEEENPA